MRISLRSTLQVARPGFWATQLWFFLLPLGGKDVLNEPGFWWGAAYATFPLGHLIYGWNDLADFRTDRVNPRKGNLLFGAKLTASELQKLPLQMLLVQLPFVAAFYWMIGFRAVLWFAAVIVVNAAYNLSPTHFKSRPLFDLANQTGYLLVFVLSSWMCDVPQLAWPAFAFGGLFAMHSHLLGQISDLEPDRAAGRTTTVVAIGIANAKVLAAALLFAEAFIVSQFFEARWLVVFLTAAGGAFAIDFALRGARTVTDAQLRWIFLAWNALAVASMYWIWRSAVFVAA